MQALDAVELPAVQSDPGSVALLMGIASACNEWIITSARQTDDLSIAISVRSDADPEHATKWPPPVGDFAGAARVVRKFGKDILEAVLTEYGYGPDDSDLIG
ncbi:MAG: hypothetical protein OXN79_08170 [bacterium]|nr:hypothetical protein [bacterium]